MELSESGQTAACTLLASQQRTSPGACPVAVANCYFKLGHNDPPCSFSYLVHADSDDDALVVGFSSLVRSAPRALGCVGVCTDLRSWYLL